MIRSEQDSAARRSAFTRRLSAAIEAQRRLDARRSEDVRRGDARGPRDARFGYLTDTHD